MIQTAGPARSRYEVVVQGDYRISDDPGLVLSTLLGSCVAVCLHDRVAKLGGMNHFLLPGGGGMRGRSLRYGVHAMELLINALLKRGARKADLAAKVFGGGRMSSALRDIGGGNIAFARAFLSREGIPIVAESLGGTRARRLHFWPATGRVRMLFVTAEEWQETRPDLRSRPQPGAIDLFFPPEAPPDAAPSRSASEAQPAGGRPPAAGGGAGTPPEEPRPGGEAGKTPRLGLGPEAAATDWGLGGPAPEPRPRRKGGK